MSNCRICGIELTLVDTDNVCNYCKYSRGCVYGNIHFGWVCSKCGRIYPYSVESCLYCGPPIKY